jgi:hypothetical protein
MGSPLDAAMPVLGGRKSEGPELVRKTCIEFWRSLSNRDFAKVKIGLNFVYLGD